MAAHPTLKTIAEAAGVSSATVSMALRDDTRIGATTRRKVKAAAVRLGYKPNPLMSAYMAHLRRASPRRLHTTIAYVDAFAGQAQPHQGGFYQRIFHGARTQAEAMGINLDVFSLGPAGLVEKRLNRVLYSRGIQGVVIAPLPPPADTLKLDWGRLSAVTIGHSLKTPGLHRVAPDQYQGMTLLVGNLQAAGYRRIGLFIVGRDDLHTLDRFSAGYYWATRNAAATDRIPILRQQELSADSFKAWVREQRPDIVVSHCPQVFPWLEEMRLAVPRDIGVAHLGLDDCATPCAGITQQPEIIGAAAIQMVISLLTINERGVPAVPGTHTYPCRYVAGPTVKDRHDGQVPARDARRRRPAKRGIPATGLTPAVGTPRRRAAP